MPTKQLIYNSNTIDFEFMGRQGDIVKFMIDNNINISSFGVQETINKKAWIELEFRAKFSQSTYYDLLSWFSYVSQGNEFEVAFDSDELGDELVTAATASGQKRIYADPSLFSVGDIVLLRSEYGFDYEIVTIDTIDSDSVLAESDLKNSYIIGDTFRHFSYFPNLLIKDPKEFSSLRLGGLDTTAAYRTFTFKLMENRV